MATNIAAELVMSTLGANVAELRADLDQLMTTFVASDPPAMRVTGQVTVPLPVDVNITGQPIQVTVGEPIPVSIPTPLDVNVVNTVDVSLPLTVTAEITAIAADTTTIAASTATILTELTAMAVDLTAVAASTATTATATTSSAVTLIAMEGVEEAILANAITTDASVASILTDTSAILANTITINTNVGGIKDDTASILLELDIANTALTLVNGKLDQLHFDLGTTIHNDLNITLYNELGVVDASIQSVVSGISDYKDYHQTDRKLGTYAWDNGSGGLTIGFNSVEGIENILSGGAFPALVDYPIMTDAREVLGASTTGMNTLSRTAGLNDGLKIHAT